VGVGLLLTVIFDSDVASHVKKIVFVHSLSGFIFCLLLSPLEIFYYLPIYENPEFAAFWQNEIIGMQIVIAVLLFFYKISINLTARYSDLYTLCIPFNIGIISGLFLPYLHSLQEPNSVGFILIIICISFGTLYWFGRVIFYEKLIRDAKIGVIHSRIRSTFDAADASDSFTSP